MNTNRIINTLAEQVTRVLIAEINQGNLEDLKWNFYNALRVRMNMMGLEFENKAAKDNLIAGVMDRVRMTNLSLYETCFPPMKMDKRGNYTFDRNKWD